MLNRRTGPQSLAWFLDLYHGKQLDLEPEYQRRSVWNNDYKQYFMDTVLKNYPSPAIFLHAEISTTGRTVYHVVDGKQRLTSIVEFISDHYRTSTQYSGADLGEKYYSELPENA